MTQEEIIEFNKRCAEFLGWEKFNDFEGLDRYSFESEVGTITYLVSEMEFHEDWNLIMEVVEAIEKLDINRFSKQLNREDVIPIDGKFYLSNFDTEAVFLASVYYWQHDNLIKGLNKIKAKTKKEAVVQAINQFLIWHNKQQENGTATN